MTFNRPPSNLPPSTSRKPLPEPADVSRQAPPPPRMGSATRSGTSPSKKGVLFRVSLLTAGILLIVFIIAGVLMYFLKPGGSGTEGGEGTSWGIGGNIPAIGDDRILLVMGVDANYSKTKDPFETTRTDTMMMVRMKPQQKTLSIVSIPRDSKVYLAGNRGIDKINAAHALGGPELAVNTVEESFGIPIDNYIVINFQGVREVIDTLGGIDVYVDKPLFYRDNTAKLDIHFQPGVHHLDGKAAEAFLRFRHDNLGDIGRIRRQQYFLSAFAKKMKDPAVLFKLPELLKLAKKHIRSDLTSEELVQLAGFAKDIQFKNIRTAILPGKPSQYGAVSYWLVDPVEAENLLDRVILDLPPIHRPSSSMTYMPSVNREPFKVGILYHPSIEDSKIQAFAKGLETYGFEVPCKAARKVSQTYIVEHSYRIRPQDTEELRSTHGILRSARLIFAPVSTTFEVNTCSTSEDYTLFLGPHRQSSL